MNGATERSERKCASYESGISRRTFLRMAGELMGSLFLGACAPDLITPISPATSLKNNALAMLPIDQLVEPTRIIPSTSTAIPTTVSTAVVIPEISRTAEWKPTSSVTPEPPARRSPEKEQRLLSIKTIVRELPVLDSVIGMSIDDGIFPDVMKQMLTIAEERCFHITFFLVGSYMETYLNPLLLRKLTEGGHELCYHTQYHGGYKTNAEAIETVRGMGGKQWDDDFQAWYATAKKILGDNNFSKAFRPYARPPFELVTEGFLWMCRQEKLIPVLWTHRSGEWSRMKKGQILLLHVRKDDVDNLANAGNSANLLHPVSIGELIASRHDIR